MGCFDQFIANHTCSRCKGKYTSHASELQFKVFGQDMMSVAENEDTRKFMNPPLRNDRYTDTLTCPYCDMEDDVDVVIRDYMFVGVRRRCLGTLPTRLLESIHRYRNRKRYFRENISNMTTKQLEYLAWREQFNRG